MDVIKEIIEGSAAGALDKGLKTLVLSIFASIVFTLFGMLVVLLRYGNEMNIQFGY
ncbi:hypothetical protein [Flagellimonas meridianipacifica]|uniref:Uncharacterized protein n=1 Tax=Flagellimonas meridianipacifica TaxID=1080225 RepID=A0A2T0MBY6_9FLAO|nr:hypothetical protein [Allomuricauda pacifica]PRX55008.1 hypothetical protein CLV81_3414 [Allomuricauda pacifica]